MGSHAIGPRGWHPALTEIRLVESAPTNIDVDQRTVTAILSSGAPIQRSYGRERLTIDHASIDLDRVRRGQCMLLDSHQSVGIANTVGVVESAWASNGKLWGQLRIGLSPHGDAAWGMIERREISAISIGFRVASWQVTDADGDVVDPAESYSDADLTFVAQRWELVEVSLCSVPQDLGALIQFGGGELADRRARMKARQAISDRNSQLINGHFQDD